MGDPYFKQKDLCSPRERGTPVCGEYFSGISAMLVKSSKNEKAKAQMDPAKMQIEALSESERNRLSARPIALIQMKAVLGLKWGTFKMQ